MVDDAGKDESDKHPQLSIFKGTPNAVKSLRKSWKVGGLVDMDGFYKECTGESDRSTIILLSTILEDAVKLRIRHFIPFELKDEEYEYIFRYEGPLGTHFARCEIATILGYIDDRQYQQLCTMRELRNACAHGQQGISLSDGLIFNVVKRMFKPIGLVNLPDNLEDVSVKIALILECILAHNSIILGSREAGTEALRVGLKAHGVWPFP